MLGDAAIERAMTELGFTVKNLVVKQHDCSLPTPQNIQQLQLSMGTLIECNTCQSEFELKHEQRDGWYWERKFKRDS